MMSKRLKSLYDEWSRLDHMLKGSPKSVKKAISTRKARVGSLIIRAESKKKK